MIEIDPDYVLPCDVHLPPATRIRKGCKLSTLLTALRVREKGWPEPTPEQIEALRKLVQPEFETGEWVTVEKEE